jgi:hypothetical protein
MMMRAKFVFRAALAVWALVVVWQVMEHHRVVEASRAAVIDRAKDITSTLGLVIRSQRRFGGIVSQPRLESALKAVVQNGKAKSIVLFNASGVEVVSAGEPTKVGDRQSGIYWGQDSVTLINLVDLGANLEQEGTNSPPTIVMSDPGGGRRDGWPRFPPPWQRRDGDTNRFNRSDSNAPSNLARSEPGDGPPPRRPEFDGEHGDRHNTNEPSGEPPRPRGDRPWRPPWMSEKEFNSLIETKGLHGLAIVLPTDTLQNARIQDLWLRMIISGFGAIAVIGFGFAWRALLKSSEYQMRLIRASELNSHLREMNVAAAGLAHETRNPLNIIRGLAQIVSRIPDVGEEIRKKSIEITEEVDRVTVQLNEFINYSKPREVRRSPVPIGVVMADVVRALNSDLEDKSITLEISEDSLIINADQQLLRQALFNLVMNAIQAVAKNGKIQIVGRKIDAEEG